MKKLIGLLMVLTPIIGALTFGFINDVKATLFVLSVFAIAIPIAIMMTAGIALLVDGDSNEKRS